MFLEAFAFSRVPKHGLPKNNKRDLEFVMLLAWNWFLGPAFSFLEVKEVP